MNQPEIIPGQAKAGITPIACPEVRDLMPALALSAIETGPEMLVRQHCERCDSCAAELAAFERVARFLPFAAPVQSPPPSAKAALFERIAAPAVPAFATFDAAIVDSPADKRQSGITSEGSRSLDLFDWTRDLVNGRTIRFAAPLAMALVFVSLYGLGALDRTSETAEILPTAQAAAANVADTHESSALQEVTLLSTGTGGAAATRPSSVPASQGNSTFIARSSRSVTQTAGVQSVAPKFSECEFAQGIDGIWNVQISGVTLPNMNEPAQVWLVSQTGELLEVGDVQLDSSGGGVVNIHLDQPMSDFTAIQISSGQSAADEAVRHMAFQLNLKDRLSQGLGRPD